MGATRRWRPGLAVLVLGWLAIPVANAQVVGGFDCQRGSWRTFPPVKLHDVAPEPTFPPPGRGEVDYAELELVVDRAGTVTEVHVCQSPKALVEAAPAAARRWQYAPAQPGEAERRFRVFVRAQPQEGPLRQVPTEALVARLFAGSERERLEALWEIHARGESAAIPSLIEALGSSDRVTRLWALWGLAPVAGADRAVPALVALLKDPASSWQPQERSSWTLARHVAGLLVRLEAGVGALEEAVQARDAGSCEALLDALGATMSRAAPPGLAPALAGALAEPACREAALKGPWSFADDQIAPFLALAAVEDVRVRRHIFVLAGRFYPYASWPGRTRCELVDPLALAWVEDPDLRVPAFWWLDRCSAAGALDAATLAAVLDAAPAGRPPSMVMARAATLLGDLGHAARDQAPALRRALARAEAVEDREAGERLRAALELVGADTTPEQWGQENAIIEAILRFRRGHDRFGPKQPVFLSVRGRPVTELLRLHLVIFGHELERELPAKSYGPLPPPPGRFPAYFVSSIRWLSETEVEADGGLECGRLCRDGGTYHLRWTGGRWEVAKHTVDIVS